MDRPRRCRPRCETTPGIVIDRGLREGESRRLWRSETDGLRTPPTPACTGHLPMSLDGVQRRLSAILSADVVGYSRLMAEDEVWTVRRLTRQPGEGPGSGILRLCGHRLQSLVCLSALRPAFSGAPEPLPALTDQRVELFHECVDVFETAVDRCEAHVGDLVELSQPVHQQCTDGACGELASGLLLE